MNFLDPELVRQHPPLSMTDTEILEAAAASPVGDLIDAAMTPDRPGRPLSPSARGIPEISEALDRARLMEVEAHGVVDSFWFSNCGRRLQPDRDPTRSAQSYDERLKEITIAQFVDDYGPRARLELARREHDYDMAAEVAEYGGGPIATVIVYSPRGIGSREYLVSQGWTRDRVVRRVTRTQRIPDCFFCDDRSGIDNFLQVDCGAVRHVFPTCFLCEHNWRIRCVDLADELDFELAWDDWDKAVGWPDDEFR